MKATFAFFALWLLACGVVHDVEDATAGPGSCCFTFGGDDAIRECLAKSLTSYEDCTYAECFPSFDKIYVCGDGQTDEDER